MNDVVKRTVRSKRATKPFPFTASPLFPRTLEMIAAQLESGNSTPLFWASTQARNTYYANLEQQLNDSAVISEDPVLARACLADVYSDMGRRAEARVLVTGVLKDPELSPRAAAIACCVLAVLEKTGTKKRVQRKRREFYQQALVLNPSLERAIIMLAYHLWNDDGDYDGACELLEQTIARRPSRVLYQDLAFIATLKEDWGQVRRALRAGESFAPLETTDNYILARAAAHLGHYKEALDILRRASAAPKNKCFAEGKTPAEQRTLWLLAEEAVRDLEEMPDNLDRAVRATLCLELLPAPGRQCVSEAIASKINARPDAHFELRIERALIAVNTRLMELKAYSLIPAAYPWPLRCAPPVYEMQVQPKPTWADGH